MTKRRGALIALVLAAAALPLLAQGRGRGYFGVPPNPEYDGRFTFSRIRYAGNSWNHDYPQADFNMPLIMRELTAVNARDDATNIFALTDPALFTAPVMYLSEPGFWRASEPELRALGEYLQKGGFLIVDDFEADQWYNFERNMRRALPDHEPIEIDETHSIFDTFFFVENPYVPHPFVTNRPRFVGWFEDNDPDARMMVIANHNGDLAEYWEYSGTGFFPVDVTNEAYKLGVNYIIYGLTR